MAPKTEIVRCGFSYSVRVALAFAGLALASIMLIAGLLLFQGHRVLEQERIEEAVRIGQALADGLADEIHDDHLWRVHRIIERFAQDAALITGVVVLDSERRIYDTTLAPSRDLVGRLPAGLEADLAAAIASAPETGMGWIHRGSKNVVVGSPILRDGLPEGSLLVRYSLAPMQEHFRRTLLQGAASSLVLAIPIALVGFGLGRRMVAPVVELRDCVQHVDAGNLEFSCRLEASPDELGDLARSCGEMVVRMREREGLLRERIHAERLAAVGRVAAGVAHEINNPLAGMLTAIDTQRRHGLGSEIEGGTLALLERGLEQIRDTVQALLMETRILDRALTAADMQDVMTLLTPTAEGRGVKVDWECNPPAGVCLPASQIRQVLLNLVLNAIQAADAGGQVRVRCRVEQGMASIQVEDDGPGLPAEQRARLFEPFESGSGGSGLGLWVTYQIVTSLEGTIEVENLPQGCRFEVLIPCPGNGGDSEVYAHTE